MTSSLAKRLERLESLIRQRTPSTTQIELLSSELARRRALAASSLSEQDRELLRNVELRRQIDQALRKVFHGRKPHPDLAARLRVAREKWAAGQQGNGQPPPDTKY